MVCGECDRVSVLREWRRRGVEEGWRAGWYAAFREEEGMREEEGEEIEGEEIEVEEIVLNPVWAARFAATEKRRASERKRAWSGGGLSSGKSRKMAGGGRKEGEAVKETNDTSAEDESQHARGGEVVDDDSIENDNAFPVAEGLKKREKERRERYGDEGAQTISEIEGMMNANYQIEHDRRQSILWPVLPLR